MTEPSVSRNSAAALVSPAGLGTGVQAASSWLCENVPTKSLAVSLTRFVSPPPETEAVLVAVLVNQGARRFHCSVHDGAHVHVQGGELPTLFRLNPALEQICREGVGPVFTPAARCATTTTEHSMTLVRR